MASGSVERDLAVARMMFGWVLKFAERAIEQGKASFGSDCDPFRLVDLDDKGDIQKRCIFTNFLKLTKTTSFYAVGFFGRSLLSQAALGTAESPSGGHSLSVLDQVVALDEELTAKLSTDELRSKVLCYFSTQIGAIDPNAHVPLYDSESPCIDAKNYCNLVIMENSAAVDAWTSVPSHTQAAVVLSPLYYSSVRIHNLHVHLALPIELFLKAGLQPKAVKTFYPELWEDLDSKHFEAVRGENPEQNKHYNRPKSPKSSFDDFFYIRDIQTKHFRYGPPERKVFVHHQYNGDDSFSGIPIDPPLKSTRPLVWTSFLGGNAFEFYSSIAKFVSNAIHRPIVMLENYSIIGACSQFDEYPNPLETMQLLNIDFSFICGVRYVTWRPNLQLIATPVRSGQRYEGKPIYFSDFIVKSSSEVNSRKDIVTKTMTLGYNEKESFSGFILPFHFINQLRQEHEVNSHRFNKMTKTGSHANSIKKVIDGSIDIVAIDGNVLEIELNQHPELRDEIKIIASTGPCSAPPFTAMSSVDTETCKIVREALITLHSDDSYHKEMRRFGFEKFEATDDMFYNKLATVVNEFEEANKATKLAEPALIEMQPPSPFFFSLKNTTAL